MPFLLKLATKILAVVFALLLIAEYVPGFAVSGFYTALIVAVILGVLNVTVRPILFVLTLPITILTLGIFLFILNAVLLWFVASFVEGFEIDGFVPALIGAFLISAVSWIVNRVT